MIVPGDKPDELEKQRTIQQNKCLHQCFEAFAEGLNDAGYSVQEVVTLPISHTKENFKTNVAHRFIAALFPDLEREDGTFHTSDLNTKQIKVLFENINHAMGTKFGVSVMWPDHWNGGKCK